MKNSLLKVVLLAAGSLLFNAQVMAHGSTEPEHGGVVKVEHEMVFELVRSDTKTSLYLRDHGKPYPTEKVSGNLTVLAAGKKSESTLVPAGVNKMIADIAIPAGAKVLVKVKEGSHHGVTVRFTF